MGGLDELEDRLTWFSPPTSFLFYFLPLVLLVYFALPRYRNAFLTVASYVFYGWWEPWFVC